MLDLNDLCYFVRVVDHGGFTAASRVIGLPKSTLSRRISELEARLGVRLIQRTPRKFVVTGIGHEYYRHAKAMLVEAEAAEEAVKRRRAEPSGSVRITCSIGMSVHVLAELVPRFMLSYPKVTVIQHVTNRYVDIVEEGFDIGLRAHWDAMADSSLVQRVLGPTPWRLFASPALVGRRPVSQPEDLEEWAGPFLAMRSNDCVWRLTHADGTTKSIEFAPRLQSDDMTMLKRAAVSGIGFVALPAYLCLREIQDGSLVMVLPEWRKGDAQISLVMPSRRGILPSVRAFADFLAEEVSSVIGQYPRFDREGTELSRS